MPLYQRAAIITSFGGFLFGFDTGTIGPVTTMETYTSTLGHFSSTVHGVIISAMLIGGTISGLFAGNIADIYGRVPTIAVGSTILGIGAAMECAAPNLGVFVAGRVIAGIGFGLFLGTLTVYICELAPARRRGPLASVIQFMLSTGLANGYFVANGTARIANNSAAWRTPLAVQSFLALGFALACWRLPPSPRWLMAKHRVDEAVLTLEKLGLESNELEQMASRADTESINADMSLRANIKENFKDMARVFSKSARKQTALACFLMAMQQFSGIDGVL